MNLSRFFQTLDSYFKKGEYRVTWTMKSRAFTYLIRKAGRAHSVDPVYRSRVFYHVHGNIEFRRKVLNDVAKQVKKLKDGIQDLEA